MVRFPKSSARQEARETTMLALSNCLAKTCDEGRPGCDVLAHLVYVGKIAEALWERLTPDAQAFLPRDVAVLLAALHDVGKIAPGFQVKIWQSVAKEYRVDEVRRFLETNGEGESAHAKIGYSALKKSFGKWAEAVGMHHGELAAQEPGAIGWQALRDEAIDEITQVFGPIPTNIAKPTREQIELTAGFIVVADWLGSDENFLVDGVVPDANEAKKRAVEILDEIGWTVPKPFDGKTFDSLFGDAANGGERFEPNETQRAFHDVATGPGVFIVEAPTGTGKTEAALWGAYRLLRNRCCNGIYFALPTRTTSDKIHERFEPFLARACADSPVARLTHGTAWTRTSNKSDAASKEKTARENDLASNKSSESASRWKTEEYEVDASGKNEIEKSDGKRFFADGDWFRPSKRALLQAFGVGTVDQALLSVLPQKHAFLRLFGLAGKVVIVDEAHSYDAYTGGLLDTLIAKLSEAGATVIVLSATLTRRRREEILALGAASSKDDLNETTLSNNSLSDATSKDNEDPSPESDSYPLISFRLRSGKTGSVATSPPPSRTIKIERCERDLLDVVKRAVEAAERGELVLCVANTVDRAQALYRLAKSVSSARLPAERIGLLHGRFPTRRRETIENEQFAIFGKNGDRSSGALLISTQVVEQSVDLDADFLITDLAPTDLLLQRIGRLWRHNRPNRKALEPRVLIVYPRENVETGGEKNGDASFKTRLEADAYVYAPYVLWRTAEVWGPLEKIVAPTDVRRLLEATYRDRDETEPEAASMLSEMSGKVEKMRNRAGALTCSGVLPTHVNAECHTRYSDSPSVDVLPLRGVNLGKTEPTITLLDGREVKLDKRWRFCDAVALARTTISCRKNRRLDAVCLTCRKKGLTPQISRVYNILRETYFKFSENLAPLLIDAETGELATLDEAATPFRYTDELGFFEEKDGDALLCREDVTNENDGDYDEEFEW